ncbi:hypothetical protein [Daejeonella sp.]|uniref:hypothetical protein n=1 Tax=Daejeonella sp. TaxID=2805397 RepID=UPI0030BCCF8C
MNTHEIQEQLQDNQEVTLRIEERVTQLENKEIKFPEIKDYEEQFAELKKLIKKHGEQDQILPLLEKIEERAQDFKTLVSSIRELTISQDIMVRELPKEIKVKALHRFEDKTKGFIFGGIILLIVTSIAVGTSLNLWSENERMQENDVKFRMVRQTNPDVAYRTDTLYHHNPEDMEAKTKQLEAQQLAIVQAEATARQVEKEAVLAKEEATKLKMDQKRPR